MKKPNLAISDFSSSPVDPETTDDGSQATGASGCTLYDRGPRGGERGAGRIDGESAEVQAARPRAPAPLATAASRRLLACALTQPIRQSSGVGVEIHSDVGCSLLLSLVYINNLSFIVHMNQFLISKSLFCPKLSLNLYLSIHFVVNLFATWCSTNPIHSSMFNLFHFSALIWVVLLQRANFSRFSVSTTELLGLFFLFLKQVNNFWFLNRSCFYIQFEHRDRLLSHWVAGLFWRSFKLSSDDGCG